MTFGNIGDQGYGGNCSPCSSSKGNGGPILSMWTERLAVVGEIMWMEQFATLLCFMFELGTKIRWA